MPRPRERYPNVYREGGDPHDGRIRDLKVEPVAVSALKPYASNARTHTKKQIRQIADSIRTFGWTNPVLIDEGRRGRRRPRAPGGGEAAGAGGGSGDPAGRPQRRAGARLHHRRQPSGRAGRMGRGAALDRAQGPHRDRARLRYRGDRFRDGRDRPPHHRTPWSRTTRRTGYRRSTPMPSR